MTRPRHYWLSRRRWLAGALGMLAGAAQGQGAMPGLSEAMVRRAADAVAGVLKGRAATPGRVRLEIPGLAENGLSVPLLVTVDSPMSVTDHVQTLHIIAPANPIPTVARLHFSPRSGAARLNTRIRLADTQRVLALAEMSDGSVWTGEAQVVVTLGGCLDPVL